MVLCLLFFLNALTYTLKLSVLVGYPVMFLFTYTLKIFSLIQLYLSPQAFFTFIWGKLSKPTVVFAKVQY